MQSFKSFADLANHLHAQDVAAAKRLRKASALRGPKSGPKVAR